MSAARSLEQTKCPHNRAVILRLDCGAGGIQYRRYCLTCWADTKGAISHTAALAALNGREAPHADLDILHKARDQYLARKWGRP